MQHHWATRPEPTKIYIYPRRIEISSYPGPVAGVKPEQLLAGQPGPTAPARNRRVGEFLKELKLAEARNTGIPKIQRKLRANGSPEATFDFDESRTYYRTTLTIHPGATSQQPDVGPVTPGQFRHQLNVSANVKSLDHARRIEKLIEVMLQQMSEIADPSSERGTTDSRTPGPDA